MTPIIMGAMMAAGGGLLYSLKEIPVTLYKKIKQHFVYSVKVYQYDDLFDMLEKWLSRNYVKQYRDVEASLHVQQDMLPQPMGTTPQHTLS